MKTEAPPTLSDVARAAGVGLATASRVINGGTNVSASTLKRVQEAIRRLGYMPNHAARILKGGRTKTIGLLVPSIADPFFSTCAEAAEEVARSHDSLLIFAVSNNDREIEMNNLEVLMRHRPDGLLIAPADPTHKRLLAFVKQSTIPIVTLDRPMTGCAGVLTDNYHAARTATDHLLEHGYKRILCFGGEPKLFTISERVRGYTDTMRAAGLPVMVENTNSEEQGIIDASVKAHLAGPRPPEAIFTLKNNATIATLQALQRLKVSVPSHLALLGFDDFKLAATLRPAISVVQQPIKEVGQRATELLFAQLQAWDAAKSTRRPRLKSTTLASTLVLRASCGCRMKM